MELKEIERALNDITKRLEAIEQALNLQPAPALHQIQQEEQPGTENLNKAEAFAQYSGRSEEEKAIAANITDPVIMECIDATKTNFPFIYLQDVYRAYIRRCTEKRLTPIFQKYFLIAANRAGYPTYYYHGKTCIWISDKQKSKPGKRKKRV